MRQAAVLLPLLALLAAMSGGCASAPRQVDDLERCIWVDRWDYRTAADVERIVGDCKKGGFTSVMFQVRGNGTVHYASGLEVWSERYDFRDPGFDPLQVAVGAARRHGLKLHAWVNVVPGWMGAEEPADPRQLFRSRPAWFLQDRFGRPEPRQQGRYLGLNPCLPEVRRYLASLCREVVARYPVDGIHLDYIRFPDPTGGDYPEDHRSLQLYREATGARPGEDPAAFAGWKRKCVTMLVAAISRAVRAERPDAALSAAVFADPGAARERVFQDWGQWTRRGLVDAVFPMNYSDDDALFAERVAAGMELSHGVPVVVVVGAYKHKGPDQAMGQIEAALRSGAAGVGVFNYRTLYGTVDKPPGPEQIAIRRAIVTANLLARP